LHRLDGYATGIVMFCNKNEKWTGADNAHVVLRGAA